MSWDWDEDGRLERPDDRRGKPENEPGAVRMLERMMADAIVAVPITRSLDAFRRVEWMDAHRVTPTK